MSAHDDFARMSDEELEKFIADSPGHTYFRTASFEYQRRQSAKTDRDSKQRHGQTQTLARWAITLAAMSVLVGLVFGVIQCRANKSVAAPDNSIPSTQKSPSATAQPQQSP